MHMLWIQSIPSMPYGSMQMPIGKNGLGMPTKGCSVCMPIVIINFKVRGVWQDSVPYMMEIILTHISVMCGIVDPDEYRFFYSPDKVMVLPPYDGEVGWGSAMPCLGVMHMDGWGFLRCSLNLSPKVLEVSPMYSSLHVSSPHW